MPAHFSDDEFWAFHPVGKSITDRIDSVNYQQIKKDVADYKNFVMFTSTERAAAEGYSNSCTTHGSGLINVFRLNRDIDLMKDPYMAGEDAAFVGQCICDKDPSVSGYAVIYEPGKDEYGLCNATSIMTFLGSEIFNHVTRTYERSQKLAASLS